MAGAETRELPRTRCATPCVAPHRDVGSSARLHRIPQVRWRITMWDRLKSLKTADWVSVASLVFALVALAFSIWTTDKQATFQSDIEERQSAPLLVPGV